MQQVIQHTNNILNLIDSDKNDIYKIDLFENNIVCYKYSLSYQPL